MVFAFEASLRSVRRANGADPPQWAGVGVDDRGRLLEYVAADLGDGNWLVYHAMVATPKILKELGLHERSTRR